MNLVILYALWQTRFTANDVNLWVVANRYVVNHVQKKMSGKMNTLHSS